MPSTHELAKTLLGIIELLEPYRKVAYPPETPGGKAFFHLCALYRLILISDTHDED
jgi:hypothetical protein